MRTIIGNLTRQLLAPRHAARVKYRQFKELLRLDRLCHERLAELEEFLSGDRHVDPCRLRDMHRHLADGVSAMVACLNRMAPGAHPTLRARYKKIDFYGRIALTPLRLSADGPFILFLDRCRGDDEHAGGKGLHLCQIKQQLDLPVPDGFIISTAAFDHFLAGNDLRKQINAILARTDINSLPSLTDASHALRDLIATAELPRRLQKEIMTAADRLAARHDCRFFAVRSSAVGEDSVLSFAGQYDSLLTVDHTAILAAYKQVLASKYSPRALSYRIRNGLFDEETPMAVLVLEMVDARCSGAATSVVTEKGDLSEVVIHATEGLGDRLLGGKSATQTITVIADGKSFRIKQQPSTRPISPGMSPSPSISSATPILSDLHAHQLAGWCRMLNDYYHVPQEIEWSLGRDGRLLLLQTRCTLNAFPEQITSRPDISDFPTAMLTGQPAANGAGCGEVFLLENEAQLGTVPANAVLVTAITPPAYVPVLSRVSAVVADLGCAADHFSSVARELGVPVVVGTGQATTTLVPGQIITVWGDGGQVFAGPIASLLHHPVYRRRVPTLPAHHALAKAAPFLFPLRLISPATSDFSADNCRSLHDVIRFVHEMGVQSMFYQARRRSLPARDTFCLQCGLPLTLYILDLGGGVRTVAGDAGTITPDDLLSVPLTALLQGLTHPGITWHHRHFDWKHFSETIMGDGIVSHDDPSLASYALVSSDYLNLNLRFGYHFAVLDCLCSVTAEANYIILHFAGGGGDARGIELRLMLLADVLKRFGFTVTGKGDLLEARFLRYNETVLRQRLDMVGRLLAATRLLDMTITDEKMALDMAERFMNGTYDFSGGTHSIR
ncbi:MAG: PEP/pyruvate-binding domain-containing protein [Thermodesulfobacteriota bacterium]